MLDPLTSKLFVIFVIRRFSRCEIFNDRFTIYRNGDAHISILALFIRDIRMFFSEGERPDMAMGPAKGFVEERFLGARLGLMIISATVPHALGSGDGHGVEGHFSLVFLLQ